MEELAFNFADNLEDIELDKEYDSFEDEESWDEESTEDEEKEDGWNEKRPASIYIKDFSKNDPRFEYNPGQIKTSMYEFMIKNYKKVMYWITMLAKSPTDQAKFRILEKHTHMDEEDIIQETYMRILQTFADNEERLKTCNACPHQCKEFLNQTKTRNTEKFVEGRTCRPYMKYKYTEKEFHNYINRSVKQNIDIKLKRIMKDGKRAVVHLEEPVGAGEDACELGSMLADVFGASSEVSKELIENVLSKKLIFINKLEDFSLDPDILNSKPQVIECENDKYDANTEELKAKRRKVYEDYGLSVPENLKPIPRMVKYNLGLPLIDIKNEFNSKFDFLHCSWEKIKVKKKDFEALTRDQKKKLFESIRSSLDLNDVIKDSDVINSCKSAGESEASIIAAKELAELDMLEYMMTNAEMDQYDKDEEFECIINYKNYIHGWNSEEDLEMKYDPESTEIKIVDSNYKVIPLPLCTYAEVSVRDFFEMCMDSAEDPSLIMDAIHNSDYMDSFKEFWVDFENKSYIIKEKSTLNKEERIRDKRIQRFIARSQHLNLDPEIRKAMDIVDRNNPVPHFSKEFADKVKLALKEEIIRTSSAVISSQKIKMKTLKKKRVPLKEREALAREEVKKILGLNASIQNNETSNIDASSENTFCPNLNPQELFSSILEKMPKTRTQYITEEVKVLCTPQLENLRSSVYL